MPPPPPLREDAAAAAATPPRCRAAAIVTLTETRTSTLMALEDGWRFLSLSWRKESHHGVSSTRHGVEIRYDATAAPPPPLLYACRCLYYRSASYACRHAIRHVTPRHAAFFFVIVYRYFFTRRRYQYAHAAFAATPPFYFSLPPLMPPRTLNMPRRH